MADELQNIAMFEGRKIRKQIHNGQWWFVVIDIVSALSESSDAVQYLKKLRKRDPQLSDLMDPGNKGGGQIDPPIALSFDTSGGKQKLVCWNTEGILRLIQSIPSPKAEPFKRWLAKVGYERVQEIENPELLQQRMKELYAAKGYSDDWIEKRMRGIAVREELTSEWGQRDIKQNEYSILTGEISKATFGMTPSEYKHHKGLKNQNLRDHMNDLELIFTMLGEASTTEIAKSEDKQGFVENKDAAQRGGAVAGGARKQLEAESGRKVITNKNYLGGQQKSDVSPLIEE